MKMLSKYQIEKFFLVILLFAVGGVVVNGINSLSFIFMVISGAFFIVLNGGKND